MFSNIKQLSKQSALFQMLFRTWLFGTYLGFAMYLAPFMDNSIESIIRAFALTLLTSLYVMAGQMIVDFFAGIFLKDKGE